MMIRKIRGLLFLSLLSLVVLSACAAADDAVDTLPEQDVFALQQEVSASGEVVPVQWITLSYPGGASELDIKVNEGDRVSSNDLLVSANDDRLLANLFQVQAALERTQLAYDLAFNAPTAAALASAESALANAEANLERQENLGAINAVISAAQADVDAAQAALEAVQAGASPEEIAAAEYDVRAAELNLQAAEAAFDLRAPFTGTVVEINVQPGETVSAFQPVLVLADLSQFQVVTTDLSEVDVTRLREGQNAEIVFDALSDQTFQGTIASISAKSSGVSAVYYTVTLALNENPDGLRWGMTAFVTFPLD